MLRAWGIPSARSTMDIDMMGRKPFSADSLVAIARDAMDIDLNDGLAFDPGRIVSEPIDIDGDYGGWRLRFRASLGTARVDLQLDIGLGDIVVPAPVWIELPTILDFPAPRLLAYTAESVVAEKLHTMVVLEKANSRMKDFYDLRILASNVGFRSWVLRRAIMKTFERRETPLPQDTPIALTSEFSEDPVKTAQWKAFVRRLPEGEGAIDLESTVAIIRAFLLPVILRSKDEQSGGFEWPPGGPWK